MQRTRDLSRKEKEVVSLRLGLPNQAGGVSQESWSHPRPGTTHQGDKDPEPEGAGHLDTGAPEPSTHEGRACPRHFSLSPTVTELGTALSPLRLRGVSGKASPGAAGLRPAPDSAQQHPGPARDALQGPDPALPWGPNGHQLRGLLCPQKYPVFSRKIISREGQVGQLRRTTGSSPGAWRGPSAPGDRPPAC